MNAMLHTAEEVLSEIRSGAGEITGVTIGDCLACLDQVAQWLDEIEASGEPPANAAPAAEAMAARLRGALASAPAEVGPAGAASEMQAVVADAAAEVLTAQVAMLLEPDAEASVGRAGSALRVALNVLNRAGRGDDARRLEQAFGDPGRLQSPRELAAAIQALSDHAPAPVAAEASPEPQPSARGLRVQVERIDALVDLVGEFTVAKNALAHAAAMARGQAASEALASTLKDQHAALERLVGELQRAVLNIRVLPLRHVFQRLPRVVREMVVSLGKPAHLVTEGEGTEADRVIVEGLFEPLLHVLRNALDHGVEADEVRLAAGKPPSATIRVAAERLGDNVVVEVEDDGGGIDLARVREVAARRGVVAAEVLEGMSDQDVADLIFAPGFSTAGEVTHLSGRGVGMDAVRAAIERLGGRVEVDSHHGQGTTVRFVLPFTLVMSQVLTVEVGGQMFGIPMEAVRETVRLAAHAVTSIGQARAFMLRDRTLPLIELAASLGDFKAADPAGDLEVVVVQAGGQVGGLHVDRLGERLEIMLKPVTGLLGGASGIAGTTLLGDGRVLIVLDLAELLA
jgi:two-component system chemotaxis sensor kinase CheA